MEQHFITDVHKTKDFVIEYGSDSVKLKLAGQSSVDDPNAVWVICGEGRYNSPRVVLQLIEKGIDAYVVERGNIKFQEDEDTKQLFHNHVVNSKGIIVAASDEIAEQISVMLDNFFGYNKEHHSRVIQLPVRGTVYKKDLEKIENLLKKSEATLAN